jgi:hypothetical protein
MQVISIYKYALKLFSLLLIFIAISQSIWANENISFGEVEIGQNRMKLRAKFFDVKINLQTKDKIKAKLIDNSFQWIRIKNILLTPRGRISINIKGNAHHYSLVYQDRNIVLQQRKNYANTEIYLALFQNSPIFIYKKGKLIGKIEVYAKRLNPKYNTHLVDYSCSRNDVKVRGLKGEFLSMGCRTQRIGRYGKEKPLLEVLWTSANWRLKNQGKAPYLAVFLENKPVKLEVINHLGETKNIEIHAKVPKRLHRVNTAIGFGPYSFETTFQSDPNDPTTLEDKYAPMAPTFMLYFNYKMSDTASVRGFDALIKKDSTFNNFGAYFANDVSFSFDNRLTITTLIGMQHLYFSFDDDTEVISEPIFPQGIEFIFRNAFDIKNYVVGGGIFLSPSESVDYQNIWIRWGKGFFWELNYIYWGKEEFSAKMFGLSIGLPLVGLF